MKKKALSLLEIILATTLIGIIIVGIIGTILYSQESNISSTEKTHALLLAEEGLEAVRNMRDKNFNNLGNGTHGLQKTNHQWNFLGNSDQTEKYTRKINITTKNENTKEITATIEWKTIRNKEQSVSLKTTLTNWRRLIAQTQQSIGNWSGSGGGSGGPSITAQKNLYGILPFGLRIKTKGNYAFITIDIGFQNFTVINFSDIKNPVLVKELSLPWIPIDLDIEEDKIFIASMDTTKELQIVDISNPENAKTEKYINLPGLFGAKAIKVKNNIAFVLQTSGMFTIVNTTNDTILSSKNLGAANNDIFIEGNYAYIASTENNAELKILDISNLANPTQIASLNLTGSEDATSIIGFPNRILIGRKEGNLSLIDTTTKNNPQPLHTLNLGGDIKNLDLGNNNTYIFAATRNSQKEFQVITIESNNTLKELGSTNTSNALNGIDYSETQDRIFTVGENWQNEFIIISPGQ